MRERYPYSRPESNKGKPQSYLSGEATPLQVPYLETPALSRISNPDHLSLMATDEEYLKDILKEDLLASRNNFLIAMKSGTYTLTAPDVMVMLEHSERSVPEAHMYELTQKDLRSGLQIVEELRKAYLSESSDPDKVFIGIVGGMVASIPRVHWHVYDLGEYQQVPPAELASKHPDFATKLGWEEDQSISNQILSEALLDVSPNSHYENFSVTLPLHPGGLTSQENMALLREVSRVALATANNYYGAGRGGYSVTINSQNLVRVTIANVKKGMVESDGHLIIRNPEIPPMTLEQQGLKRANLERIVAIADSAIIRKTLYT